MITSPGMGVYQKENWRPRHDEINHVPICGTPHTGGHWCKACISKKHYSWVDVGEVCGVCAKKKLKNIANNKL